MLAAFWVVVPCRLVALMMAALRTSETLVNSHQSMRRSNVEGSHLKIYSVCVLIFTFLGNRKEGKIFRSGW